RLRDQVKAPCSMCLAPLTPVPIANNRGRPITRGATGVQRHKLARTQPAAGRKSLDKGDRPCHRA
ncbi:MAG: hypothetical protein ACREX1_02485, partial [Advenella sp.]